MRLCQCCLSSDVAHLLVGHASEHLRHCWAATCICRYVVTDWHRVIALKT